MLFKKAVKTKISINMPVLKVYAVCNKKVLGKICCTVHEGLRTIEIGDIECQKNNRGYGSIMMEKLIEYARENEFLCIHGWLSEVDYDHKERLYHFYQKFGFEIIPDKEGLKFADIKLEL